MSFLHNSFVGNNSQKSLQDTHPEPQGHFPPDSISAFAHAASHALEYVTPFVPQTGSYSYVQKQSTLLSLSNSIQQSVQIHPNVPGFAEA